MGATVPTRAACAESTFCAATPDIGSMGVWVLRISLAVPSQAGDETVVGHVFVAYEEVERVEYVALYRVLAEHEQVAEHELGIPARLGVDLVKGLGHGFAAALYLYGLSLFPLVGGLRHGDLSGQDKGRSFSVDSGRP